MISGIGVDCVQLARMQESLARARFAQKVFSEGERALFAGKTEERAGEIAAGCFAAKEAFLKACGRGLGAFALTDIAALRNDAGAPYYACTGAAAAHLEQNGLVAHLSITHDGGLAIAFALLEKTGG